MKPTRIVAALTVALALGIGPLMGQADGGPIAIIPLGNLFDDNKGVSLALAVGTDAYHAAAQNTDLGVERVVDGTLGGNVVIAPGITFNLVNVGGHDWAVGGLPSNDTYRDNFSIAIRTRGYASSPFPTTKVEDGVGMHANELLTFDLDEIRASGGLAPDTAFIFHAKAGINDDVYGEADADIRAVAIVSGTGAPLAGYVNGQSVGLTETGGVYSFTGTIPGRLFADGVFVDFRFGVPGEAKYLTLATTSCEPWAAFDHGVFSGARIVHPEPATLTLFGLGALGLLARRRRKSRQAPLGTI